MMSNYWPSGLKLSDVETPLQILAKAKQDWEKNSDGLLTLVFQSAKSKNENDMIIVHAKQIPSNRSATIFKVVHRQKEPYPLSIFPLDDELPRFLQREYTYTERPSGFAAMQAELSAKPQKVKVKNEWVSETPSEFRIKLQDVFNLGYVKSVILNLVSPSETYNEHIENANQDGIVKDEGIEE